MSPSFHTFAIATTAEQILLKRTFTERQVEHPQLRHVEGRDSSERFAPIQVKNPKITLSDVFERQPRKTGTASQGQEAKVLPAPGLRKAQKSCAVRKVDTSQQRRCNARQVSQFGALHHVRNRYVAVGRQVSDVIEVIRLALHQDHPNIVHFTVNTVQPFQREIFFVIAAILDGPDGMEYPAQTIRHKIQYKLFYRQYITCGTPLTSYGGPRLHAVSTYTW